MERINLGQGLEMSRIVYGMWRLGDDTDTSTGHVQAKIDACLAQGITTMDQADIYGGYEAEEGLGKALKAAPQLKDQIEIVTKCDILIPAGRYSGVKGKYYDTSRAHIVASVDHSLRSMNVDKIDTLLIHRPDPFMDRFKEAGIVEKEMPIHASNVMLVDPKTDERTRVRIEADKKDPDKRVRVAVKSGSVLD